MAEKVESELVSNRRARYNYEMLDTLEAGISLLGSEVKSLRAHGGNLQDAYILIDRKGEAWLKNASIAPYQFAGSYPHEERRERKLLLHKRELARLHEASSQKGLALIPLSLYLRKGRVKVKIAIARGKKQHDKREATKAQEQKKQIEKAMKGIRD